MHPIPLAHTNHPPLASSQLEVNLEGHLTVATLARALQPLNDALTSLPKNVKVVFDCRNMTGYDREARHRFVEWHRTHLPSTARIAIITNNVLWHLVISTMALAAARTMRPFSDKPAAYRWLSDGSER